jgi:hypothetical protein
MKDAALPISPGTAVGEIPFDSTTDCSRCTSCASSSILLDERIVSIEEVVVCGPSHPRLLTLFW